MYRTLAIVAMLATAQAAPDPHRPAASYDSVAPSIPKDLRNAVLIVSKTNAWRHIEHIPRSNVVLKDIAAKLGRYIVRPQVAVSVVNAVSQKVTVDGSVEQPGVYAIQGRTTLIDALAMARGTSRVAALEEVIVFREIDGRPAAARFNIKEIRMGRQPNTEILGNDTVVVGFSNIKGVYRDLVGSSALLSSFVYLAAR